MAKNVYKTKIEPNLEKIRVMVEAGAMEQEIYKAIGISESSWYKYKQEENKLSEMFKDITDNLISLNTERMTKWLNDESVSVADKLRTIEYMEKTRGKMMIEKDRQYFAHQRKLYELKLEELELKKREVEIADKNADNKSKPLTIVIEEA